MSKKNSFSERARADEAAFFARKEQELLEKMRRRAAAAAERKELADAMGITNEEILTALQDLGYDRDSIALLHLVPLVEVAWADNAVAARERDMILDVAKSRGVEEGSVAFKKLESWLTNCPEPEFFEKSLHVIRAMLESLPADQRDRSARDLVTYTQSIAEASGGFLGLGRKVSEEEREVLERIAAEIEKAHAEAADRVVHHE
jgi:hypothetical protein